MSLFDLMEKCVKGMNTPNTAWREKIDADEKHRAAMMAADAAALAALNVDHSQAVCDAVLKATKKPKPTVQTFDFNPTT